MKARSLLYNAIIRASMEKGSPGKFLLDYKALLQSDTARPDHRTFTYVLKACKALSNTLITADTHARIVKSGHESEPSLAASLFSVYMFFGRLVEARSLFDSMLHSDPNPTFANLMIAAYLRSGAFEDAYRVFSKAPTRDLVSWNSMIGGGVKNGRLKEAIGLFRQMLDAGHTPDGFTFSTILSACARAGAIKHGEWVHDLMGEKCIAANYILGAALINMYSKCGSIEYAKKIFESVPKTDVSVWNSMITGLAIHGLSAETFKLFAKMESEAVEPDSITFVAVLTACSHCGPRRPEIGEAVIGRMAKRGSGDYVLLARAYTCAEWFHRAENVWDVMRRDRVGRKKRGLSWVEMGGAVHEFKAGDRAHRDAEGVYQTLGWLSERARLSGFARATECVAVDVLEEKKEGSLDWHSEKLAVAFAVMKTAAGTEVRVSKNLRTCVDCHLVDEGGVGGGGEGDCGEGPGEVSSV
ncbi:Pentatricopeptide repeat-containing protein [Acorus calamus]|uniref:Pentatricopeptide repeat-containing protein n=1 Tax=Acorus calamus TaxID=4465 RepID=A0AAV9E456_ACOCL|nr:Pentatricopeptide repeat-containing protein [Acorus calamus]